MGSQIQVFNTLETLQDRQRKPAPASAAEGQHPILRNGSEGPDVVILQNELIEAGFKVDTDGDFGPNTEEAVRAFQASQGLDVDGVVGESTWNALVADKG